VLRELMPLITMLRIPSFFGWILPYVPIKRVQRLRILTKNLDTACRNVYESKKRALECGDEAVLQQLGRGKDIMSILVL
jgi:hypothetical protein